MSLFKILCKCLFSEVTVQAVTELDNKAAHCHSPVLQRHRPFLGCRLDWNRFLDTHYRRGWNVNISRVMDNATHVAVYFGSYLKKPPVPMSRLEHYAGQDEIGLRYNSHRTKREEYLLMSGDEFMERFSWHVADKGFRMVRYYGFLSPVKRRLLEEVVYVITETVRKTAMQITRRGMYQRLPTGRAGPDA